MNIITTTETAAVRLKYDNKENDALKLCQNVLRALKILKSPKSNLTKDQQKALKKTKNDNPISIYSYDKGAGLVVIKNDDTVNKIKEQIGTTETIQKDPTQTILRKIQTLLRSQGRN